MALDLILGLVAVVSLDVTTRLRHTLGIDENFPTVLGYFDAGPDLNVSLSIIGGRQT
jgi:hypothetical protein